LNLIAIKNYLNSVSIDKNVSAYILNYLAQINYQNNCNNILEI